MTKNNVRGLTPSKPSLWDARALNRLLSSARWQHVHLDWFEAHELISLAPILLARRGTLPVACLSCPPEPDRIGWLRLFLIASGEQPEAIWDLLWPHLRKEAVGEGMDHIAALCTHRWLPPILHQAGFHYVTDVIFLERDLSTPLNVASPSLRIRPMTAHDLPALTRLDHRAFSPIWRHSLDAMRRAMKLASLATVLERDGELLGYQISTAGVFGAHLARVAVDPDHHGQGLGTALITDCLHTLQQQGHGLISVNTQADNLPSQRLYQRLGFVRTGTRYPVLSTSLHPEMA